MSLSGSQPVTTIDQLLALPDDGSRHELLNGEHVMTPVPSLRHQRVLVAIQRAFHLSVSLASGVELLLSPADIHLGPRTLVQPDLFLVARQPADTPWPSVPVPLLVVEVLSPSTAMRDRTLKRRIYLDAGVEEYWIIDADAQAVERWREGEARPEIIDGVLDWSLSVGLSGSIDFAQFFAEVNS